MNGIAYIVHVAGSYDGRTQRCTRCKTVLTDNRFRLDVGPDVPSGAWREGGRIGVNEEATPKHAYPIEDTRPLEPDETDCMRDSVPRVTRPAAE